jgi:recombination protein RecA
MPTATIQLASPPAATHDLHAALAEVDRRVGAGVAFNPDPDTQPTSAAIPTGSLALDLAIGVGGVPRGRITEVYGPEGAGKTTRIGIAGP